MKESTKAVLLSGLVFPGIGHMVLKKYWRGTILVLGALIAASVMLKIAIHQAQSIVDRMVNGEIPLEAETILEMASGSASGADSQAFNISVVIFGVCWMIGIIDSYRVGKTLE